MTTPEPEHPTTPPQRWLPLLVVGALLAAYAGLSHYSSTHPEARSLGAALSIGPLLLIALVLVWRWSSPLVALLAAAALAFGLHRLWPAVVKNYEWADLAQQCGAYVLVAASFAHSLLPAQTPLCEQLAAKMHGALAASEIAYLRWATLAWALFYLALAVAIGVLYFTAPLRTWSLFVNFGTFGFMFLAGHADHVLRRRWLPHHAKGGLLSIIRQALIG